MLGFYKPYCQRHQQATCLERACGWGSFGCVVVGKADLLSVDSDPQPFRNRWLLYAQHCCECFAYVNSLHPHNSMRKCSSYSCFQTRSLRPKRLHPTQAHIGGGGRVRSYHTDPWFNLDLRFSAVGKGIQFVIATPHADYNNLNGMVWSCPLYTPGKLLIVSQCVYWYLLYARLTLLSGTCVTPAQDQMDIGQASFQALVNLYILRVTFQGW